MALRQFHHPHLLLHRHERDGVGGHDSPRDDSPLDSLQPMDRLIGSRHAVPSQDEGTEHASWTSCHHQPSLCRGVGVGPQSATTFHLRNPSDGWTRRLHTSGTHPSPATASFNEAFLWDKVAGLVHHNRPLLQPFFPHDEAEDLHHNRRGAPTAPR